jgi:hypothetical protein
VRLRRASRRARAHRLHRSLVNAGPLLTIHNHSRIIHLDAYVTRVQAARPRSRSTEPRSTSSRTAAGTEPRRATREPRGLPRFASVPRHAARARRHPVAPPVARGGRGRRGVSPRLLARRLPARALLDPEGPRASPRRGRRRAHARLRDEVHRVALRVRGEPRAEARGKVLADRYHLRVSKSPRQTRNLLKYVLLNTRHHADEENARREKRGLAALRSRVTPYSTPPPPRAGSTAGLAITPSTARRHAGSALHRPWRRRRPGCSRSGGGCSA